MFLSAVKLPRKFVIGLLWLAYLDSSHKLFIAATFSSSSVPSPANAVLYWDVTYCLQGPHTVGDHKTGVYAIQSECEQAHVLRLDNKSTSTI